MDKSKKKNPFINADGSPDIKALQARLNDIDDEPIFAIKKEGGTPKNKEKQGGTVHHMTDEEIKSKLKKKYGDTVTFETRSTTPTGRADQIAAGVKDPMEEYGEYTGEKLLSETGQPIEEKDTEEAMEEARNAKRLINYKLEDADYKNAFYKLNLTFKQDDQAPLTKEEMRNFKYAYDKNPNFETFLYALQNSEETQALADRIDEDPTIYTDFKDFLQENLNRVQEGSQEDKDAAQSEILSGKKVEGRKAADIVIGDYEPSKPGKRISQQLANAKARAEKLELDLQNEQKLGEIQKLSAGNILQGKFTTVLDNSITAYSKLIDGNPLTPEDIEILTADFHALQRHVFNPMRRLHSAEEGLLRDYLDDAEVEFLEKKDVKGIDTITYKDFKSKYLAAIGKSETKEDVEGGSLTSHVGKIEEDVYGGFDIPAGEMAFHPSDPALQEICTDIAKLTNLALKEDATTKEQIIEDIFQDAPEIGASRLYNVFKDLAKLVNLVLKSDETTADELMESVYEEYGVRWVK